MIINVRGNSGSGKSTLTRNFMELCTRRDRHDENQIMYYKDFPWAVLGRYETPCGGCDTIKTQAEIVSRINFFVQRKYNVWLEGLLISGMYGTLGQFSERFEDRWVFAFLDTPLEVCLRRVQQRRNRAGNSKPFNPTNTVNRHAVIERTRERLLEMQRRVIMLPYHRPLEPLLKLIKEEA